MTTLTEQASVEPIDVLMPPPRPWWLRLVAAATLLIIVGVVAYLWGFGYLRPAPDCCGSGSSTAFMTIGEDGDSVTITAYLFNSSPSDLVATGAQAQLSGAEVVRVEPLQPDGPLFATERFPIIIDGHGDGRFAVTFKPLDCDDAEERQPEPGEPDSAAWGTLTVDLAMPDSWYPTLGRSYQLEDPLVSAGPGGFAVTPPSGQDVPVDTARPLTAACQLLAAAQDG